MADMLAKCATGFVLFLASTGALIPLLHQTGDTGTNSTEGDPVTQVLWLGVYAIVFLWAITQPQAVFTVVRRDKLLLILVGIAVVSVLWSAVPELTARRSVALIGTT